MSRNNHAQQQTAQQCYTRQEPDGTIVTTTVQTKYMEPMTNSKYVEEETYGCGPGTLNSRYCTSPVGILRIAEIVVALVLVCLITSVFGPGPFKGILFGQTFIMLFDGVALCLTFIFLLVYFFNLHRTHLDFWPWVESDFLFAAIACVVFLICAFIEAYYSTGAWSNNCNDIGGDGVIHNGCRLIIEWAFAAFLCFVLCVLYAFSAFFANRERTERHDYRRERHFPQERNFGH